MNTRQQRTGGGSEAALYDRPVGVGLGVVGAAWGVTLTFLILMLFA